MGTIKKFEDIEAWQKARELVKAIYRETNIGTFSKDYGLKDQMRRAAVSILSNIAEGLSVVAIRSLFNSSPWRKDHRQKYEPNYMLLWTRATFPKRHSTAF